MASTCSLNLPLTDEGGEQVTAVQAGSKPTLTAFLTRSKQQLLTQSNTSGQHAVSCPVGCGQLSTTTAYIYGPLQ